MNENWMGRLYIFKRCYAILATECCMQSCELLCNEGEAESRKWRQNFKQNG